MYKGHRITVVVPAHNEERFICRVIETMPAFVDHIIVVDDCSTDETYQRASQADDGRVTVLSTPVNQGVGGATIAGYRKALELDTSVAVKMDGDGQMPPEYLACLLDAIVDEDYDYAKGNRFLIPEFLPSMPKLRLFGNIVLTFMTKLASGYWHIFDPQNGYTAIKVATLRTLDFNALHKRYFFENDMLFQLNLRNARVKDVAIPARYGDEESALNPFQAGVTFPFLLLRRFFRRIYWKYVLRDFSPIALFLFSGLALFFWGFLFGLYSWFKHAFILGQATPTGTVMLAVLPLILGFQLLLQAIVLDIQETPR